MTLKSFWWRAHVTSDRNDSENRRGHHQRWSDGVSEREMGKDLLLEKALLAYAPQSPSGEVFLFCSVRAENIEFVLTEPNENGKHSINSIKITNICSWVIHFVSTWRFRWFIFCLQDSSNDASHSTFRRTLNALRHRITRKRQRTKPPDKLADKYSFAISAPANQAQASTGNPSDGITSRLSFDPSLSSYYRVIWPFSFELDRTECWFLLFPLDSSPVVGDCLLGGALQHHLRRGPQHLLGNKQESDFPLVLPRLFMWFHLLSRHNCALSWRYVKL